jgi:pimeloyl-ACP methyl ester carboxylesterase
MECWNTTAPLDWDAPAGRQINLFVTHVVPTSSGVRRQVWFLDGGPGSWGVSLAQQIAERAELFGADTELLFPDHRGTGYSAPLTCDQPQYDFKQCIAELIQTWGKDGLAMFSATSAARDLQWLINATID